MKYRYHTLFSRLLPSVLGLSLCHALLYTSPLLAEANTTTKSTATAESSSASDQTANPDGDKKVADASSTSKVHEYVLKNGFKVLVLVDSRAPVAVSQVWYRVGGSYEYGGITGVSHILEHMMFKGTDKHPSGEFETIMARNGAQNNAFTSQDYTVYYEILASERLEIGLEIEADRMRNIILTEAEFAKELEVVKEERRLRTDDNPYAITREQFNAVAFMNSPYRSPIVGWMVDLDSMQLDDLKQWYQRWYAPNNATLVVVGDVDPDEVHKLAEKHFAEIKTSELTKPKPQTDVPQKGTRMITVKGKTKVPYLRMGFKVPNHLQAKEKWEPYALEVLANILDGGSSARFSKNLVRDKELVASASASYFGYGRLSDLFVIGATPSDSVTLAQARQGIEDEIKQLKESLVSKQELERVKAQVIADEVYERDSIENMATVIGSLDATGLGYNMMDEYVPAIMKITAEQIQAVAKKYLHADTLTIAELIPEDRPPL